MDHNSKLMTRDHYRQALESLLNVSEVVRNRKLMFEIIEDFVLQEFGPEADYDDGETVV